MSFIDYYQILDINFPSNVGEIKTAYRKMSLKWHPDINPGIDTSGIMTDINEAYYVLKDPVAKQRYDSEYLRYMRFKYVYSLKYGSMYASYADQYMPQDANVKKDITEAREKASELVAEFLSSLKKSSNDAAKGAWTEMQPYIIAGIILLLITLIVQR